MKIKAMKYEQKGKNIYVFTSDPNYIVKLIGIKDISRSDDNFQRPFDEKRIEEIRQYVLGRDRLYKGERHKCERVYSQRNRSELASKYKYWRKMAKPL
jgi:hypothetical protein